MAESSLQDRLRDHAKAFDGLLSLIPAKVYYGKDTTDQWKKKKQTKAEAAAARRAKLDPDSAEAKSAKDVMDERVRKRKLEETEDFEVEGVEKELPKQGLKLPQDKKAKKQKTSDPSQVSSTAAESTPKQIEAVDPREAKRQKAERKKERKLKKSEKTQQKALKAKDRVVKLPRDDDVVAVEEDAQKIPAARDVVEDLELEDAEDLPGDEIEQFQAEGLEEEKPDSKNPSSTPSPSPHSPTFDNATEPSANTSTSSVIPPATAPKHIKLPTDPELLRARLAARIEALRAARKADGPDGAPARNRQELMEARRKKEEQRRAHKKDLRLKAKIEEDARREAALASARDSPASGIFSPAIQSPENNFSFGRVSFADGQQLNEDLSALRDVPKKKGPQDAATALQASEKKRLRLAGLDEEKRADIEEKDLWLNAKKRAQGEKIRDDTSLLKKTLKRKDKAKKKSEKEWNERKEGVAKGQAMRQKKREENLKKRRDEKGGKGKGKGKGKSGGVSKTKKPKVKSRPGFEGSFGAGKRT
ncbi:Ribosome biogenesis RRP14 [Hyphodiscus hymeniophilus]|uniref:Ribosome biogenesis RRP14 n=1 Tax=Hyphodiscus hymeniophilus TaxID=353542 RepID=A0A9P7AVJ3_9HELO|nr:Ribosome biogenesis RRP14 [Hyphodiscus hymeniophilus]